MATSKSIHFDSVWKTCQPFNFYSWLVDIITIDNDFLAITSETGIFKYNCDINRWNQILSYNQIPVMNMLFPYHIIAATVAKDTKKLYILFNLSTDYSGSLLVINTDSIINETVQTIQKNKIYSEFKVIHIEYSTSIYNNAKILVENDRLHVVNSHNITDLIHAIWNISGKYSCDNSIISENINKDACGCYQLFHVAGKRIYGGGHKICNGGGSDRIILYGNNEICELKQLKNNAENDVENSKKHHSYDWFKLSTTVYGPTTIKWNNSYPILTHCPSYPVVLTDCGRYAIIFGADFNIYIHDIINQIELKSNICCIEKDKIERFAIYVHNYEQDLQVCQAFIHDCYANISFKLVQRLPTYLVAFIAKYVVFESIYLYYQEFKYLAGNYHWKINLDDIFNNTV